MKQKKPMD